MLMIMSPAKTLDFATPLERRAFTRPQFPRQSRQLIERLQSLSAPELGELMDISAELARLNAERFANWRNRPAFGVARPALLAFRGEAYLGLRAETFNDTEMHFAQQHLRILSGLYGLLRPLDLIQAYRLEMGRSLGTDHGDNLYQFWGDRIAAALNAEAHTAGTRELVNLASQEYFRAVDPVTLALPVITPVFKEERGGQLKVISFSAKRARGMMVGFAVRNGIRRARDLKQFAEEGYRYEEQLSSVNEWVFVRPVQQVNK